MDQQTAHAAADAFIYFVALGAFFAVPVALECLWEGFKWLRAIYLAKTHKPAQRLSLRL